MRLACASCGAEHPAGARFCSACGAALQRTCPGCGSEQPAKATFCSACGIALRAGARRAAAGDERQERRVVTVLFADLAGSTALGEQLDPEDVRTVQSRLFGLVATEVERFGGTTEKFVGDAVLAVFGTPRTHEDDPERAVRAALAMRDRFGSFAAAVESEHGVEVALRIGVNTGEVVAGREAAARGELMVSGDAVNVAARLQQHADPGEVLVGRRTRAATSRAVSYRPHEAVPAKGKRDALAAWVAVAVREEAAGHGHGALTGPLIGRDEELTILAAVAARAERERAPQLVTLYGQAGVGKSRLLAELVERLSAARVLRGRCLPYGDGIVYWPLAEAAKGEAGILDTDPAGVALTKLRAAIASILPEEQAERVLEAIGWTIGFSLPGGDGIATEPREVARRLREAWERYLAALGRTGLAIFAVEDIHWAAPGVLELLEHLSERLTDTRVLLVCTARPQLLETLPTWGAGKPNATALTLGPLLPQESERLVSSLLGAAALPDGVRERLLSSADGNPFFVEEILHMLIEERALERRDGRWAATDRLTEIPIPDSVHGAIAARIDLLGADARYALRRCSVVGRTFWPAAVAVDEDVIASLERRGLVADHPDSVMAGMREFSFKHALTRDVAYASLPRPERRELHRRVADWVQEVAPDRDVEAAELAGYHYEQAIAYGEDDPAVLRRAHELLVVAGESALERGALVAAGAQLDRALELADDDRGRAAALLPLARLDVETEGRLEVAVERLDRIDELLGPDDAALRADALGWRSRACWLSGRWEEALSSANGAVAALAGRPESRQLARALARRSQIEMLRSRPEALDHAMEALAVARRVGGTFAEVNARITIFTARAMAGVAPDAGEMLEIVDAAARVGAHEEVYRAIANFVWSATGFLPVERIELAVLEARQRAADVPPPHSSDRYLELSVATMLLVPAGRWAEADAIVARLDGPALNATSRLVWLGLVAGQALRRGDVPTAGQLLDELRPLALASGEPQRIIPMACVALPWALLAGEREELRSLGETTLAAVDGRWSGVLTTTALARALALAGEDKLLARTVESLQRSAPGRAAGKLPTSLKAAAGLLAFLQGRPESAAECLRAAAAQERELGCLYEAACIELDLARALDAAGDEAGASELRARAASFLEQLGCRNPF